MKDSTKWLLGIGAVAAAVLTVLFVRRGVKGAEQADQGSATLAGTGWEWDGLFREPQSDILGYPDGTIHLPMAQLPFSVTAIRNTVTGMTSPEQAFKYEHPAAPTTYYIVGLVEGQGQKMVAITPSGTGGLIG
jgi:hypothetical protein